MQGWKELLIFWIKTLHQDSQCPDAGHPPKTLIALLLTEAAQLLSFSNNLLFCFRFSTVQKEPILSIHCVPVWKSYFIAPLLYVCTRYLSNSCLNLDIEFASITLRYCISNCNNLLGLKFKCSHFLQLFYLSVPLKGITWRRIKKFLSRRVVKNSTIGIIPQSNFSSV